MSNSWDYIRTAYLVAKTGTVSAASETLRLHRATVVRHIDALEGALQHKLFIRHERGYALTDIGRDLLATAHDVDSLVSNFLKRTRAKLNAENRLVISGSSLVISLFLPIIEKFRESHPHVQCRQEVKACRTLDLADLRNGETHVAATLGPKPTYPNFIVRNLFNFRLGMYASAAYVKANGIPQSTQAFSEHWFVGHEDPNGIAPFAPWRDKHIPADRWALETDSYSCVQEHIASGLGIGFSPEHEAIRRGLIEVVAPKEEWVQPCWLVTHRDTRKTLSVERFLETIRKHAATERGFELAPADASKPARPGRQNGYERKPQQQ
ncbi:MAG: LysR family transcriptional regulator [Pseudomonadota bacterium]